MLSYKYKNTALCRTLFVSTITKDCPSSFKKKKGVEKAVMSCAFVVSLRSETNSVTGLDPLLRDHHGSLDLLEGDEHHHVPRAQS